MARIAWRAAWAAAPMLVAFEAIADPAPPVATIAFVHATVVDVEARDAQSARLPDRTVVIQGGRIVAVGPAGQLDAPVGAQVIDATGRFVIPGLWDMHAHTLSDALTRAVVLPLDVANGVTGIRDMAGDCVGGGECDGKAPFEVHARWREDIARGALLGPRMIVGSAFVDGPSPAHPGSMVVADAAQAREAVRYVKRRGIDFLKVYNKLSRDSYFALADEARKLGVTFAGHVPAMVGAIEAARAGQKSEEHLFGALVACSGKEAALIAERQQAVDEGKPGAAITAIRTRQERSLSFATADCTEFFAALAASGTWIVPTYGYWRADSPFSYADAPRRQDDPRLRFVPASVRKGWEAWLGPALAGMTTADIDASRAAFRERLGFARRLHEAGVPLLAGTDSDVPFAVPGFSLHDELATMVEAGLAPLDALRMATANAARYQGRLGELGTVAAGKLADLVVLDADPVVDILNTRRIRAVVVDGRLLDRAALDELLAAVAARAPGL